MTFKIYKFVDFFRFLPKSKKQASDGRNFGLYKFFTSSPAQKKWIDEANFGGEALVFGTGGSASIHYVDGKFSTSTDCLVAELIDNKSTSAKYVWHYLMANIWILESGFKGAGLKHISKKYIENIEIPTPSFDEQKRIVAILDTAKEIKAKRELAIEKLDELVQCTFADMFIKAEVNKTKWDIATVEECASYERNSIRTGPFGSDLLHSEFTDDGIAVLGIDNAVTNNFSWSGRRYISQQKYLQLKRYTVNPSDVLITIMGTCGRCAVVPEDIGLAINTKHLCCITLNKDRCLPTFLHSYFLLHPASKKYLVQTAKGAIMNGLNMNLIKKMPILLPPIFLQKEYEQLVIKFNEHKEKKKLMLIKCNLLIQSLQHQLFAAN